MAATDPGSTFPPLSSTTRVRQPLRFKPQFRQYIWGGRRLAEMLEKPIGEGDRWAESWEVVDRAEAQSVVDRGPLAGHTLRELLIAAPQEILGRHAAAGENRFPLLFKYLDCQRVLSIQVHPDDAYGSRMKPPDLGKTEAWYVVHAEPGSVLYAGLKTGVDRAALAAVIDENTVDAWESCLHVIEPKAGDCVFISAGTVHALGAGLVVAEIQQSSDTTFRLFDWNRLDADGKLRPLHTEQSLAVTDYRRGPVAPQQPLATDHPDRSRLVACDKFVLDRWQAAKPTNKPWVWSLSDGCALTTVVRGTAELEFMNAAGQTERASFRLGETALLPAALQEVRWLPSQDCVILSATLP